MVNHRLQRFLELELNALEASPVIDDCKKKIDDDIFDKHLSLKN
jgi:hypothetical protein